MGTGEDLSPDKGVVPMVKLSAMVIARNEEGNIRRCLESLMLDDEIVLVDAESHDGTVNIAKEYAQRVYFHPGDGFVEQRSWRSW